MLMASRSESASSKPVNLLGPVRPESGKVMKTRGNPTGPGQAQRPIYRGRINGCNRNPVITLKTPSALGLGSYEEIPAQVHGCPN